PRAKSGSLDLGDYYNAALTENWHHGLPDNDLASLPHGVQTFDGVEFDVRGIIQLRGLALLTESKARKEMYPTQVKGIPINRRVRRLHFLHAAGYIRQAEAGDTL